MANDKPRKYRPLLRWHGGKWMLANWVVEHMPRHHLYVEPFGGAASVLLRKPRSKAEVYNDLDATLVHLFRVLRDPNQAEALVKALELTLYSEDEFRLAYEATSDPVELARRTIVRSFMGYGSDGTTGRYPTGFRANVTSNLKMPAQEWAAYPTALRVTIERLKGVTVLNRDGFDVMKQVDGPGTLHYVDPPYPLQTRSTGNRRRGQGPHVYEHELTDEQHLELLAIVKELKGMVMISSYPSEMYDGALDGWERIERQAYADGGRPRTEVLFLNPLASRMRHLGHRPRRHHDGPAGPLFPEAEAAE